MENQTLSDGETVRTTISGKVVEIRDTMMDISTYPGSYFRKFQEVTEYGVSDLNLTSRLPSTTLLIDEGEGQSQEVELPYQLSSIEKNALLNAEVFYVHDHKRWSGKDEDFTDHVVMDTYKLGLRNSSLFPLRFEIFQ